MSGSDVEYLDDLRRVLDEVRNAVAVAHQSGAPASMIQEAVAAGIAEVADLSMTEHYLERTRLIVNADRPLSVGDVAAAADAAAADLADELLGRHRAA